MAERLSNTAHGDAPLSAAHHPDARASALWATEEDDELIARTMTINRSIEDLMDFIRQPANLTLLLGEAIGETEAGALVIEEEGPSAVIWHAGPQQQRRSSGRIALSRAPAGRGTEATVTIATEARGAISRAVDKLTQDDPRIQSRRALRRFKQLMETGEIATTEPGAAAPRA
jgi:uncharacterized membrane protein